MSILSTSIFRKCQVFVEKVSELRFKKVKSRQVNKFNNLLCKKEGNITWEASPATRAIPQASVSSSQAGSHLPWDSAASQEGSDRSQAVRHSSRLRACHTSQGDNAIPQVDGKVFQASGAPNSTASQATRSTSSQEARA